MFIYSFVLVKDLRHEGSVAVTYDVTARVFGRQQFVSQEKIRPRVSSVIPVKQRAYLLPGLYQNDPD